MSAVHTYPGLYIEEVPSDVRTITAVSTSNTAFIDYFPRGSVDGAVEITSWGDFVREFGGLDNRSEASYAIQQFYLNGGQVAFVVRAAVGSTPATLTLIRSASGSTPAITLEAANPGVWGRNVQVTAISVPGDTAHFNLVARELRPSDGSVVATEVYRNLNLTTGDARYAPSVANAASALISITDTHLGGFPDLASPNSTGDGPASVSDFQSLAGGGDSTTPLESDGTLVLSATDLVPADPTQFQGIYALDRIAPTIFNILCLPAAANMSPGDMTSVLNTAETFCEDRRAFFLVDITADTTTVAEMQSFMGEFDRSNNAATYFPRVTIPDPLQNGRPRNVGASGTLAGIYSRTDSTRGVWKAPAGTDAVLQNASLTVSLTNLENGELNPLGINVLRNFPVFGTVVWGGRTVNGADQLASQWKYIPVRRTALFLEESLYESLQWVVFEPNDEPLWAQIRLNVGAFLHNLFRQGAFQGNTPAAAYFVKCDSETTTQTDIDSGVVNIWVGFAPLEPAEFVVIKIQQIAGQIET